MAGMYGPGFHAQTMIGAGPLDGSRNPCPGDSGGPLFIPGEQARLLAT